ncbi:hypothetical protein ACLK1T_08755 [Escherichia coli]
MFRSLYMEGACGVRLNVTMMFLKSSKTVCALISLGYIGIHETINALFGGEHVYDNESFARRYRHC